MYGMSHHYLAGVYLYPHPGADFLPAQRDPVGVQVRAQLRLLRQGHGQVRRVAHRAQQVPTRQDAPVSLKGTVS